LEYQAGYFLGKGGGDPINHLGGDAFGQGGGPEGAGVDVGEASFDVEEECGDSKSECFEGSDLVSERQTDVEGTEGGEGTTLVGTEKPFGAGQARRPDRYDALLHC